MKVLIADDHAILRGAVKRLLRDVPDIEVIGEACDVKEAMANIRSERWDVLLLDLNMPDQNPLDLVTWVKIEYPSVAVLILSMCPEEQCGIRAIAAGASGYVHKQRSPEQLVTAIRRVASGGVYFSGDVAVALARNSRDRLVDVATKRLSERELTVLRALSCGKSITHIARDLNLSAKTVSTYRARLLTRLNLHSNVELARYAVAQGLID